MDCSLFIDAKHRRVLRRIHIEPNDIGCFSFKFGIVGQNIVFDPMQLKASTLPDPGDPHVADPKFLG